jgi:cytochrome c-550 PedF
MKVIRHTVMTLALAGCLNASLVWAHGDVVPQAVDTTGLDPIGAEWVETNPYRGKEKAIHIGKSAYGQNCARCHGLEAVSGGIAPDLRNLPNGDEGDEIFKMRVQNGSVRNGVTYMPKFDGVISQEGLWTIRSWLETVSVETQEAKAKEPAAPAATDAKPADAAAPATTSTTPAESTPAASTETKPTESTSAPTSTETKPAESTPATSTSTETKPAETSTVTTEVQPVATTETKPAEKAQ